MDVMHLETLYANEFAAITRQQVAEQGQASWAIASQLAVQNIFYQLIKERRYLIAIQFLVTHDSPGSWEARPPARGNQELVEELASILEAQGQIAACQTLWRRISAARRIFFVKFLRVRFKKKAPSEDWLKEINHLLEDTKTCLLAALVQYQKFLKSHGTSEQVADVGRERAAVEAEQVPTRKIRRDSRKIDEDVFWELIEKSRGKAKEMDVQMDELAGHLEGFAPREIVAFQKILNKRLFETNRHEFWAIATILMGGFCSDDSFLYFRCMLVTRGRAFYEATLKNLEYVAKRIKSGDPLDAERLLYVAAEAYQNLKGESLPTSAIYRGKTAMGTPWLAEDLSRLYPAICKRFGFPND